MNRYFARLVIIIFILTSFSLVLINSAIPVEWLRGVCKKDNGVCQVLLKPLKPFFDTRYTIKRSLIAKNDFPKLHFYLSGGSVNKLQNKRNLTLSEDNPILITEKNDWVKAKIIVDDGNQAMAKGKLRLKGDWVDHLKDESKLSYRVKLKKNNYVLGMSKFSIQHPKTRNYQTEALISSMMRKVGVIAPRYSFVDTRINDSLIGVMAIEEHFTKELLESQQRRAAPILAIDEDLLWRQRFLNLNRSGVSRKVWKEELKVHPYSTHYSTRDFPIKEFNNKKNVFGTINTNNSLRGHSLLRDFMDGNADSDKTFDMNLMSKWWILINIWNAGHATIFHNLRFYFNPITNLLEPISFDNQSYPEKYVYKERSWIIYFVGNKEFQKITLKNIKIVQDLLESSEFIKSYNKSQENILKLFALDDLKSKKVDIDLLKNNLSIFSAEFSKRIQTPIKDRKRLGKYDVYINKKLLDLNLPLNTHVRVFNYLDDNANSIEIKNLTLKPVTIKAVYAKNKRSDKVYVKDVALPFYTKKNGGKHKVVFKILNNANYKATDYYVDYIFNDKLYTVNAYVQFRGHKSALSQDYERELKNISTNIEVDDINKLITIPSGVYDFKSSISIPKNWSLLLKAGVTLNLSGGILIRVNGPLKILGEINNPVVINIKSKQDFNSMGSWGGILVVNSSDRSYVRHAKINGDSSVILPIRQDYYGLTGCVTFYNSDVNIKDTTFNNLQCEDSLNIVHSAFRMFNVGIYYSNSDAMDSDFSRGIIENSEVKYSGNDGFDFSGSNIKMNKISLSNISDKAISVGEKTVLSGHDINIQRAGVGIASKDLSSANLQNIQFDGISGSALITYIKKKEYGPASIDCKKCIFDHVGTVATNQEGSAIKIDDINIDVTDFSKDQLIEAGYVQ